MNENQEQIKVPAETHSHGGEMLSAAAVKFCERLYTGTTHVQAIIRFLRDASLSQEQVESELAEEMTGQIVGFLTNTGRFIDLEEAFQIAQHANQVKAGWDDPQIAAGYMAKFAPEAKKSQPRLHAHAVESFARPNPDVIIDLADEARGASPVRMGYLLSVMEALKKLR